MDILINSFTLKEILRMLTNYHSHTHFSDGSSHPEEYVRTALEAGMSAYGFSCHAPIPFPQNWCIKEENLKAYLDATLELKRKYLGSIELYVGLEIDYIPGKSSVKKFEPIFKFLDYTIGSVHYLDYFPDGTPCNIDGRPDEFARGMKLIWKEDIRLAIKNYFAMVRSMLENAPPVIVGHIDKIRMHNRNHILFDPKETWYQDEVDATIQAVKQAGCIMEINTRAIYKGGFTEPYPDQFFFTRALEMNIPMVINTDAHKPEDILKGRMETISLLQHYGVKEQVVLLRGKWQIIPL